MDPHTRNPAKQASVLRVGILIHESKAWAWPDQCWRCINIFALTEFHFGIKRRGAAGAHSTVRYGALLLTCCFVATPRRAVRRTRHPLLVTMTQVALVDNHRTRRVIPVAPSAPLPQCEPLGWPGLLIRCSSSSNWREPDPSAGGAAINRRNTVLYCRRAVRYGVASPNANPFIAHSQNDASPARPFTARRNQAACTLRQLDASGSDRHRAAQATVRLGAATVRDDSASASATTAQRAGSALTRHGASCNRISTAHRSSP